MAAPFDGVELICCLFTGTGPARYPDPTLDERGAAAHFHSAAASAAQRLSGEALIGAAFPFCQQKHAEKVE